MIQEIEKKFDFFTGFLPNLRTLHAGNDANAGHGQTQILIQVCLG